MSFSQKQIHAVTSKLTNMSASSSWHSLRVITSSACFLCAGPLFSTSGESNLTRCLKNTFVLWTVYIIDWNYNISLMSWINFMYCYVTETCSKRQLQISKESGIKCSKPRIQWARWCFRTRYILLHSFNSKWGPYWKCVFFGGKVVSFFW